MTRSKTVPARGGRAGWRRPRRRRRRASARRCRRSRSRVMFDTPEADAILSAMQVFPPDNPWNQDISALPVHADSARMIASHRRRQDASATTWTWASSSCRPTRSRSR